MNTPNKKEQAELLKKLGHCRGIEPIIAIGYQLLGNPFIINDTSYRLFARTENTVTDDPLWNELTQLGTFSHGTVDFFRAELFIDEVAYTDSISALKSKELKYDRINCKLFDSARTHICNLCVVACYRPFKPDDYVLLEKICTALEREFERSGLFGNPEQLLRERAIAQLLETELQPNTPEFDALVLLEQDLKSCLYFAVIDISAYDHTASHLRYFRDTLQKMQNEFHYFTYLENIVVLLSTDGELDVASELGGIQTFILENNLYTGISSRFSDLFEARIYFRQAINALNHGMVVHPERRIFMYDDYRIDHLLSAMRGKLADDALSDPTVEAICAHDAEHDTTYFDTLFRFLLIGGMVAQTADGAVAPPEDVQAIADRFHIDWHNGNRIAGIFLCMKAKLAD